jgi:tripartite-type tricarboxylate transporter receptor subunit TctC
MKLHGDLLQVLKMPEMSSSLQKVGQEPAWQDAPEKFFDFMKIEAAKWARVVKASGAVID